MSSDRRRGIVYAMQLAIKRALDVILCMLVLFVSWPLLLVIALAVKLTSRGPVFFIQDRLGLHMRTFRMVKFRTMSATHRAGTVWTASDAQAVTRIGGFLRDFGLDELPQVINILRGDMSIIGPRPPLPSQADRYDARLRHIFDMKPGVLSLAAVKGRRAISVEQRNELHLEYVQRWSLALDAEIFWKCAFIVLLRQNAEETGTR